MVELASEAPAADTRAERPRPTSLGWLDVVWWALAILPPAFLAWVLAQHFVEVLWADDWTFVPLVTKTYEGTLTLRDLWFQQNEHRPFFTTLVLLPLIYWSRWNTAWGQVIGVALAALNFLLIARQVRTSAACLSRQRGSWFLPLLSVLLFSLSASYAWVVMSGMVMWLVMLVELLTLFWLTSEPLCGRRVAWAAAAAVVATFSCANGLALWPVGLAAIATVPLAAGSARWRLCAAWTLAFAAVATVYARGFVYPTHHPSFAHVVGDPLRFIKFVVGYLGVSLTQQNLVVAGLGGVALFLFLIAWLVGPAHVPWRLLAPAVSLGACGIASAVLTGVGRGWEGVEQVRNASQYIVHANFLWIANAALLYLLFASAGHGRVHASRVDARLFRQGFSALVAYVLAVMLLMRSLETLPTYRRHRDTLLAVRAELLSGSKERFAPHVGWYLPFVVEELPKMRQHRLSLFRDAR